MIQTITIIATAIITSIATNYFSYLKEKKFATSKFTEKVFLELYSPLFKKLESFSYDPIVGYEGMYVDQYREISRFIFEKLDYADKDLLNIINNLDVTLHYLHREYDDPDNRMLLDDKYELYNHVAKSYNILRRSLGLPYNKFQIYKNRWYIRIFLNYKHKRFSKKMRVNLKNRKNNT